MLSRQYTLKTRYNFKKVLKYGETFHTDGLIIKYLKDRDKLDTKERFGIIISSRFSKKAVIKNKLRRIMFEAIRLNLGKFPSNYSFIFIPKKKLIHSSGKIYVNVEDISSEINSFLSEMDFIRPK